MAGKRKKAKYIEYDYEAIYNNELEGWNEYFVENMLKTGKVKCTYATKEVYAGNQLEVEMYPEFTRSEAKLYGIPKINKKKQKESQKKLNTKNSWKNFWRLAEHNFKNGDYWITFTYATEPASIEEATKKIQGYFRSINAKRKRRGLPNAKYMYVTETVSEDGTPVRTHHHVLMDNALDLETVMGTWKHGGRNNSKILEKDEDGIEGASAYMAKTESETKRKKYAKRWSASTNLEKPKERKHHLTRQSIINQMVKNQNYIKEYMEKKPRYQGYIYSHSEVYYNDYNARFYIRIRMRKARCDDEKTQSNTKC